MEELSLLKNMSMPFGDVLTGRARLGVLLKRKDRIQKQVHLVLECELSTAKGYFDSYAKFQQHIEQRVGENHLSFEFGTADSRTRQDMLEERWGAVFASAPDGRTSREDLYIIWIVLQLPFVHEIPKLAQGLDKVISALKDEVPEALLE